MAESSAHGSAKKAAQPKKARPRRSSSHNHGKAPLASEHDGYAMGSYDNDVIDDSTSTPSWVANSASESQSPVSPANGASATSNAPHDMVAPIPFHLHTLSGVPSAMPGAPFSTLNNSTGSMAPPGMSLAPYGASSSPFSTPSYGQMPLAPPAASAPPNLAPAQNNHQDAIARILALQQANMTFDDRSQATNYAGHVPFRPHGTVSPMGAAASVPPAAVSTPPFFPPASVPINPFATTPTSHVAPVLGNATPSVSAPPSFGSPHIFPNYSASALPLNPSLASAPLTNHVAPNHVASTNTAPTLTNGGNRSLNSSNGVPLSLDHLLGKHVMITPLEQQRTTPPSPAPYHDASAAAARHSQLKSSNKSIPNTRTNNIHAHHNFGVPAQP